MLSGAGVTGEGANHWFVHGAEVVEHRIGDVGERGQCGHGFHCEPGQASAHLAHVVEGGVWQQRVSVFDVPHEFTGAECRAVVVHGSQQGNVGVEFSAQADLVVTADTANGRLT